MRRHDSMKATTDVISAEEFKQAFEARWGAIAEVRSETRAGVIHEDPGAINVPSATADFVQLQALFAAVKAKPAPRKGPLSEKDQSTYVDRAVRGGRLGASVVARVFKGVMGTPMAQDYGDSLMADFFAEYQPTSPQERFLVEHLVVVHAQTLLARAKWAGAERLDDIEKLTRIQSRLGAEMLRLLDALASQREGKRTVIGLANFANQQLITQTLSHGTEQGATYA